MSARWGAMAWLAALCGCAEVLNIPDDPELVATGPWRCVGQPAAPRAALGSEARVEVQACDFVSQCASPVTGLRARLCMALDPDCTNPLRTGIVDEDGLLAFDVPTPVAGFEGYLEITSATASCTSGAFGPQGAALCAANPACDPEAPDAACEIPLYVRSLLFFNPPIVADTPRPIPVPLLPSAAIPTLIEAAHQTRLDPSTGNLFVTALDCDGAPAAGVSYRINKNQDVVTQIYVADKVPTDSAYQTDESGIGGFLGVPPGYVTVSGNNADLLSIGEASVVAAAFTMTYTTLAPSD